MPLQQLNVTELDFDQIKKSLKDFYRSPDSPFKDWDFDGSGLNQILDILAYNTHFNAILAHMSINESFLDSAQIRANAVSGAKLLGYVPSSYSSPKASVNLTFAAKTGPSFDTYLQIPRGTKFKSSIDGKTFTFFTTETVSAPLDTSTKTFNFQGVTIAQGSIRTRRHSVNGNNPAQKFVIEDSSVDMNDLQVNVYANSLTTELESYTRWTKFDGITGDSPIYFIVENYAGKYEVSFGDNIFGKRPSNLSIVELSYTVTDGDLGNGCSVFSYADTQFSNVIGVPKVSTVSVAAGGGGRETIESIRYNAPLSLIAQNRAVTAEDYKAIIRKEFSGIDAISVWGGETNPQPQFGKVFISIKPSDADYLTDLQKGQILEILAGKKVLSITPEIIDPDYTNLFFDVYFKFNSNRTSLTQGALQEKVRDAIIKFNEDYLQSFDGVFRFSQFLGAIDRSDPSILNTLARVYLYKNISLSLVNPPSISVNFGMPLSGKIDQEKSVITSTSWISNGQTLYLGDEKMPGSTVTARRVFTFTYGINQEVIKVNTDVGRLYLADGSIELTPILTDSDTEIRITVQSSSDDIAPKRNQILKVDAAMTAIFSDVDTIAVGGASGATNYTTFTRSQ